MRRRPLFLAAAALPIALGAAAVLAPGCGSGEDLDDICGWLRDPTSCYRQLHDETRTRCGEPFVATGSPGSAALKASGPVGRFVERGSLDTCVLDGGGQVTFESIPPVEEFPVKALQATRLDTRNEPCATLGVTSEFNFSVQLHPCSQDPEDEPPVCLDAIDGMSSDSGQGRDPNTVVGGTFSVTTEEGRDIYLTTCPDGTSFRFNRFESAKCEGFDQLLPRAEIDSDPGGTALPWEDEEPYIGWIRLRLYYPPVEGELEGAAPEPIQYFNCVIPAQSPCDDGIKNFFETDVDCGGPVAGEAIPDLDGLPMLRPCERCEGGLICEDNADCKSGSCVLNLETGFNECADEGGGTGGSGGAGGAGGGN